MNVIIPQSIDGYLEQLTDKEPRARYDAIRFFAYSEFVDRFWEVYNAVWKLTEDIHPDIRWAAGIAASMIAARHMPIMNKGYISITANEDFPNFLGEWPLS